MLSIAHCWSGKATSWCTGVYNNGAGRDPLHFFDLIKVKGHQQVNAHLSQQGG
ncbi:hypothetical protein UY286_15455 [Paenibacillus polymyxa]|uniref:hypothetical protein n=1 Tax=Paenibacillus polymyxa TaxID=1406 RepID=UPI002AB441C6|nr:hypothetical protein [Paenibacillus polymyxa]MDY7992392.1 hypothetical protein [Paenibacillus polymyxa]MDY8118834.1 hypothetical protein [Paenibacillus polymyxa]